MSLKYRPEIDGLRALAVIPVILFHAGFSFASGGFVGVDIFFVISGYLISTIIFKEMASGKFSLLNFYERRARRILPALFFIALICLPFAWVWMNGEQWREFSESLIWTSLFSSNIFFWQHSDYFASAAELKPLLHTWSLAVEEQFYLFFPLIVMALWRFKRSLLFTALGLMGSLSFIACIIYVPDYPEATFFLTPFRIWELLAGVGCAVYINKTETLKSISRSKFYEAMSLIGIGMIFCSILIFDKDTPFPSTVTLIPVIGSALIIIASNQNNWSGRLLSLKPFVVIGLISYSAYLWHHVIFAFTRIKSPEDPTWQVMLLLSALSLVLAFFTWQFVEQPFRKKSGSKSIPPLLTSRKAIFAGSIVGMITLSSIGSLQAHQIIEPKRLANIRIYITHMTTLTSKRRELIGHNRCEITPVHKWRENWNCHGSDGLYAGLKPVPIAIVGDSHGSDKAMMLRQMGYSPTQYTAGYCSAFPSRMGEACRGYFLFALEQIKNDDEIKEIWISNRLRGPELTKRAILQSLDFWAVDGKTIVYFSAMPEFRRLREQATSILSGAKYSMVPNWEHYELSRQPFVLNKITELNGKFVDVKDFICVDQQHCEHKSEDNQLYYLDEDHLTPFGANIFGQKLVEKMPIFLEYKD